MVIASLIYFLSSLFVPTAAFAGRRPYTPVSRGVLVCAGILYVVFAFVAFGKIAGFILAAPLHDIIYQPGYDCHLLPLTLGEQLIIGFYAGTAFNLFSAVWIWLRAGVWWYALVAVVVFCLMGLGAGPWVGMTPIHAWFSTCCITMASVGWVLGLTYVEFCVLGNIWLPIACIMGAAAYLIYAAINHRTQISYPAIILGGIQLIAGIILTVHYLGNLTAAFYRCIRDLHAVANMMHISYKAFNILLYAAIFITLMALDLLWAKHLNKVDNK